MRLSVREQSLVSIYHSGTRTATLCQMREALPHMDDEDAPLVEALLCKLDGMSEHAFAALALSPEEVSI